MRTSKRGSALVYFFVCACLCVENTVSLVTPCYQYNLENVGNCIECTGLNFNRQSSQSDVVIHERTVGEFRIERFVFLAVVLLF